MSHNYEVNSDEVDWNWMRKHARRFAMHGNNVQVLNTPDEFYNVLMQKAKTSTKRIVLASLYLGTGKLEEDFVKSIQSAAQTCRASDGTALEVQILLDCNRGSRGKVNSRTMLLPLIKEFGDDVNVSLYHTPDLNGFWKKVLPERWNEIVSLAHIKVYIFDDDLVISGANLSDSYFTNRQDRYMLFKNVPEFANYYQSLVHAISTMSFQLRENDTLELHKSNHIHPYLNKDKGRSFRKELEKRVNSINFPRSVNHKLNIKDTEVNSISSSIKTTNSIELSSNSNNKSTSSEENADTWVYPLIQLGSCNIKTDSEATEEFFRKTLPNSQVYLASGYFNLTQHYMDVIVNKSAADFNILTAAPEANGFYGGKGVSGSVPTAYTYIAKKFYGKIAEKFQENRIKLQEYSYPGWTFHVKGLWYYLPGRQLPCLTFIGSPNFGYRSVYRDLESQVIVCTTNKQLQQGLHQEQLSLYRHSAVVNKNTFARRIPMWVKAVVKTMGSCF